MSLLFRLRSKQEKKVGMYPTYCIRNSNALLIGGYHADYVMTFLLLIDQAVERQAAFIVGDTAREPKSNFTFGRLDRVGTVANIATDIKSKVTTNGTGSAGQGVGFTKHLAASFDDILASPDHTNDRTRKHVLDQSREERLAGQVLVLLLYKDSKLVSCFLFSRRNGAYVFLKGLLGGVHQFKSQKLVATVLEALDDFANESTLDT